MDAKCREFEVAFAAQEGRAAVVLFNSEGSANLAMIQALKNLGRLKDGGPTPAVLSTPSARIRGADCPSKPSSTVLLILNDLYHLKHFSLALDLTILLKTVKRVLIRDTGIDSLRTPFPIRPASGISGVDIASIIRRN